MYSLKISLFFIYFNVINCKPNELCKHPKQWACWNYVDVVKNCLNYTKSLHPMQQQNTSQPTQVAINFEVPKIRDLNTRAKEIGIDIIIRIAWIDERLKQPKNVGKFHKDFCYESQREDYANTLKSVIWTPLATMEGVVKKEPLEDMSAFTQETVHHMYSQFNVRNGHVFIELGFKVTISCPMDFAWFPFDSVRCTISMVASKKQSIDAMELSWNKSFKKHQKLAEDEVSGWYLDQPKKSSKLVKLTRNGNPVQCSALLYTLKFKRVASYELMQTIIPSLMLSFASSSSLYVNYQQLPARIGLSGTTFLSMIALFKGSSGEWPQTSYLKMIDIWTILCYSGAFFCLIEYALVLYLTQDEAGSNSIKVLRKLKECDKK